MGRSRAIPVVVEVTLTRGSMSPVAWNRRVHGAPNAVNLTRLVEKYNAAFAPGGCNYYPNEGVPILAITAARIVRASGEVLAEWSEAASEPEGFAAFMVEGI